MSMTSSEGDIVTESDLWRRLRRSDCFSGWSGGILGEVDLSEYREERGNADEEVEICRCETERANGMAFEGVKSKKTERRRC